MARKLAWYSFLLLAAVSTGIVLSVKPWQLYTEQKKRTDQVVEEMKAAEKERANMKRQIAHYDNSIGKEQLARQRGWRKPEEKPLETSH